MSLGSEQFLQQNGTAMPDIYDAKELAFSDESAIESDPIDDTTIDDSNTAHTRTEPENGQSTNGLMSLLSGNQMRKKRKPAKLARKNSQSGKKSEKAEPPSSCDLRSLSDPSDVLDTSFDVSEFERNAEKTQAIEDLEKRMFASGKTVSLKDFLKKGNVPRATPVDVPETTDAAPEIISVDDNHDEVVVVDEFSKGQDLDSLYPYSKSVSARDIFDSLAPKRVKKLNGEWSLKVRLRVHPAKLAAIKKFEDPFRTKGNACAGDSILSTLMRKKPSKVVTLNLPRDALRDISKTANPFYTKSSGSRENKNANSVFAMMMKTASQNTFPKLTELQKLKGLHPPPISRELMHILPEGEHCSPSITKFPVKKHTPYVDTSADSMAELVPDCPTTLTPTIPRLRYDASDHHTNEELVSINAPLTLTSKPHEELYTRFIQHSPETNHLNWPQKFQPTDIESLLIKEETRRSLKRWIANAFAVLETQSTKTPRNIKIRELQKKQRKKDSMSDFIVDDFDDDEENTDEDVFVPILIIQGDSGSCKSASIYAAMSAMKGYVHEINTGQARAKKDLHSSLREFCTTQIIHNHEDKTFQKGLVLFEDCDILLEQDKTFWTTVQEVINYSRRPIVVTVKDLSAVPKNVLELAEEQNSILSFEMSSRNDIKQYLWLCAFSEGLDLAPEVLESVLGDCQTNTGTDLRKALMACQWVCRVQRTSPRICKILYESPLQKKVEAAQLDAVVEKLDAVSISDMIENNTHSSILHDIRINELLDIYVIDDSLHLRQQTLPHELNTGISIREVLDQEDEPTPHHSLTFNDIRTKVLDFIWSREKKIPRFIQQLSAIRVQTRSRSSEENFDERPETQGLPDTSVCYSMNPQAFVTDLAPITRYWASFQKGIVALDEQSTNPENTTRLQDFLGWRKFYDGVDGVLATGPFSEK